MATGKFTLAQQNYHRRLRKLSRTDIIKAKEMYAAPLSQRPTIQRLADLFDVSHNTMYRALRSPTPDT